MSHLRMSPFERADVFHLFDTASPAASASVTVDSGSDAGTAPITEMQYTALLYMVARQLGISHAEAEHLFPSYKHEPPVVEASAASVDTKSSQLPPLCAHLSREGAGAYYWATPDAHTIPYVRCCDAREMHKQEMFPSPGHGPHVHCLRCFQQSIEKAPSPGPGVPPPVVVDYRDSRSLRAHLEANRTQYITCLRILEDSSSSSDCGTARNMLSEDLSACEVAAEEASRHICFMASLGTVACPLVVFYCAECDSFAPLVRFRRMSDVVRTDASPNVADAWEATESANMVLSRLLLSCHVLYMFDARRFSRKRCSIQRACRNSVVKATAGARHLLYMFKPLLFSIETEEALIEEFESGAECTYAAVVLPNASVEGYPPQLLLREDAEGSRADAAPAQSRFSPVVIGYAMEWATAELLDKKVAMVLEHTSRASAVCSQKGGTPSSSSDRSSPTSPPFRVTTRMVYIVDTEEWAVAHVLYHYLLPVSTELPLSYVDTADEGIRVEEVYEVDVSMPTWTEGPISDGESSGESEEEGSDDAEEMDVLAMDGCPYSMESYTIDFFTRMTALAKAMHEVSTWQLTIDENKDLSPL
ncbi:hypothetical protein, conserved [Leishmania tarentolae]|uniref:Uncharacterized protein n=1 Tax=Leishmania tarentolae TaxID=5689 RepID=A0A640KNL1_LEITA|nr:hypothetical protein, conserved [Leishmania tarentolae]